MDYRIGIDLGTNSLGWAAIELRDEGDGGEQDWRPGPMIDMGVRIFSDARNPKDKSSNAAQRRGPRGLRRNRDRRILRREAMLRELTAAGLFPGTPAARKSLEVLDPWILRARALDERLAPHEVGRALFHLQQRRGFKSNRKADGEEDGAMFDAIQSAREAMRNDGAHTLGELMGRPRLEQARDNADPDAPSAPMPQARVKASMNGSKMAYDYYPDRAMILDEFESIWNAQAPHYPDLMTPEAHDRIRYVIEHQRPLKSQRAGKCTFLPEEERAPKALPTAQYARILQDVNALRVGAPADGKRPLTSEERAILVAYLMKPTNKTARRTFKAIRKRLNIPESQSFSHESRKRDHLVGDLTAARMMQDEHYGSKWFDLPRADQDALVLRLLDSEQFDQFGPWAIEQFGLSEDRARGVFKTRLPDQHGKLSKSALDRLIPHLEAGRRYDEAAAAEFEDHRAPGTGEIFEDGLPYYGEVLSRHTAFEKDDPENEEERFGRVANPTVHVALNELRKVINDLIKRYGPPTQIVLELARDLPLSDRGLRDLESRQKANQDANDERRASLEALGQKDSYDNRLKLRLFEEAQEAFGGTVVCVFSGDTISKTQLFDGTVEVEHILPLSRTLDDSFSNKVLATRRANRVKKNQSPYEAFSDSPDGFDWEAIGQRANQLPPGKGWRFEPDAMERWAERGDFLNRQLNDTRYIARLGKTFVEAIYGGQGMAGQDRNVWAVPGRLTADLRRFAGMNQLTGLTDTNQKDRTDHRHHAVDALIVALTDHAMVKAAADLAKLEDASSHYEIMELLRDRPLNRYGKTIGDYRKSAEDRLAKMVVSHKPDHGFQDAMHNDTAYGLTGQKDAKGNLIVVTRKLVETLKGSDLDRIADRHLAARLKAETGGLSGKAFSDALKSAAARIGPGGVKSVRLHEPMGESSLVVIEHGDRKQHVKAYKGDGNYCYDIFMGHNGKWAGEVITTYQAYQLAKHDPDWWKKSVGREGQPLIMRLRKGDMLELDVNGQRRIVYVYALSPTQIPMAEHMQANASARCRAKELPRIQKVATSLQKADAVKITVTASGKVRRHSA